MRSACAHDRLPAAFAHVLDDRPHGRLQRGIAALRGAGEGLSRSAVFSAGPDVSLHIIIFSMGMTEDRRGARGLQVLERLPEHRFLAHGMDREMAGRARRAG